MKNVSRVTLCLFTFASIVASTWGAPAHAKTKTDKDVVPRGATKREIEMGDKSAKELEANPKIKLLDASKDPKAKLLIDKLNAMVGELGKASARPDIKYQVKIIDDDDLNAFTLPDGKIYVYRGLIDFAGSDDELAAVLAHEIGHNARMHALRGQAKSRNLSWVGLAAMAAMLTGKSGADIGQFSQFLLMGILNGYSEEYEKEADSAAIEEMTKTKWNPSAIVTFMTRLNGEEKQHPEWEPGIFRTHPPTETRAAAAIDAIQKAGLPFTPRDVQGARQANAILNDAKTQVQLKFGTRDLAAFAVTEKTSATVLKNTQSIAEHINALFKDNLKMHEIDIRGDAKRAQVLARGEVLFEITTADAALQKQTPVQTAMQIRTTFRSLFWRESLQGSL